MTAPASLDFSTDVRAHERDFCLARVRDMLRIRRLEERCAQLYGEQKIRGFLHLYIGEEAVAASSRARNRTRNTGRLSMSRSYCSHGACPAAHRNSRYRRVELSIGSGSRRSLV